MMRRRDFITLLGGGAAAELQKLLLAEPTLDKGTGIDPGRRVREKTHLGDDGRGWPKR